jgi:haloalkane dehalogenase
MTVQTPLGSLYVTDQPGDEPTFVLMHGFPDDSHIYDRLVPLLAPRRVVTFDFLGYGRSDRSEATGDDHLQDLAAVVDSLAVEQVTLVAHDASGPVAIDYAINEPGRVSRLVLLNTYYGHAPMLQLPDMIRLFADEHFARLADALLADLDQRLWLLQHTARQFGSEELDPAGVEATSVLPQFFGAADTPDALSAIRGWTGALFAALDQQDERIASGQLTNLDLPVTLLFGERDPCLSPDLARHLAGLFPHAEARIVEGASHWPQWDQPEAIARFVKELAP